MQSTQTLGLSKSQHVRLQLFVECAQLVLGAGWDGTSNQDDPFTDMEQEHLQNVLGSINITIHIATTVDALCNCVPM
jgi:hypothetical protein